MLRAALEARKLDASGLKAVLVARLSAALGAEEGNGEGNGREGGDAGGGGGGGNGGTAEGDGVAGPPLQRPLSKNTLPVLRDALKARNLSFAGRSKAVLVACLSAALGDDEGGGEDESEGESGLRVVLISDGPNDQHVAVKHANGYAVGPFEAAIAAPWGHDHRHPLLDRGSL